MYLASEQRTPAVTVAEVAQQFAVSHDHLVKVVGAMVKLGWLAATRGRNGGIQLRVAADSLRIGTVLRALEGDNEVVDCSTCPLASDCILRSALRVGVDAFYDAMNRHTLADLVRGNSGIQIIRLHRQFLSHSTVA